MLEIQDISVDSYIFDILDISETAVRACPVSLYTELRGIFIRTLAKEERLSLRDIGTFLVSKNLRLIERFFFPISSFDIIPQDLIYTLINVCCYVIDTE